MDAESRIKFGEERAYTKEVLSYLEKQDLHPTFVDRQTNSYRIKFVIFWRIIDQAYNYDEEVLIGKLKETADKFSGVKFVMAGIPKNPCLKVPFKR